MRNSLVIAPLMSGEVGGRQDAVVTRDTVLSANLCELTGPIRDYQRTPLIGQGSVVAAVGVVITDTGKPSTGQIGSQPKHSIRMRVAVLAQCRGWPKQEWAVVVGSK